MGRDRNGERRRPDLRIALLALICTVAAGGGAAGQDDDYRTLTAGVKVIAVHGSPGPVVAFGPKAFPIVVGKAGEHLAPLAAASRMGKGRVVAFGHDGYLNTNAKDGRRLLTNMLLWLSGRPDLKRVRVGTCRLKALADHLKGEGVDVREVSLEKPDGIDVLVVGAFEIRTEGDQAGIAAFVQKGGGLLTAATGWAWSTYVAKGKDLATEFRGNRLLLPAGIAFTEDHIKGTSAEGFDISASPPALTHAGRALEALEKHQAGETKLGKGDLEQAAFTITAACRSVSLSEKDFFGRLERMIERGPAGDVVPTEKKPVKAGNVPVRVLVAYTTIRARRTPTEDVKAHPAAAVFPGAVPKNARPVTRDLKIDASVPRWHSTGLYAAPGAKITVTLPESAAGADLRLRIGAHRDGIWGHDAWKRCPEISRSFPLISAQTEAANAFGGLVYVEVPKGCKLGAVPVQIRGAVAAPWYVHGKTDLQEWRKTIRRHPAPWAEIGSDKWIMTVPSGVVRDLDDPKALMDKWDRGLDLVAELAARPKDRPSPERLVCDVQISAGWLHSGYPIMGHLPHAAPAVDVDRMGKTDSGWGFFHELGHNHQHGDWTFAGTGEVTCNLFTLYVFDRLSGIDPAECARTSKNARLKQMKEYFNGGASFDTWKKKPFLALVTYVQMQQEFGWESFLKVFREYRDLPGRERPKTDDEKRDQWLIRYSRTVGRNLGPFFEAWRIPTSEKARKSLSDLPEWMPEELQPFLKE